MNEIQDILKLLRTGSTEKVHRNSFQLTVFILKMLLILVAFKALSIGLVLLLDWLEIVEKPLNINGLGFEMLLDVETLIYTSIFAPILEEISFRLPLRFSKWNVFLATIGLSFITCKVIFELGWWYSFFPSLAIGVVILSMISETNKPHCVAFWQNHKKIIFYGLLLTFGFLHLKNYDLTFNLLVFSPIIILPRFLGGLVFSYVRLSSGIVLAICFHAFNNSIYRIITFIFISS